MDPFKHIIRPIFSEDIYNQIEINKLVFEVTRTSNKHQIKQALEMFYEIKLVKVNTLITPHGKKRAIVTLAPEFHAIDLATDLNLI